MENFGKKNLERRSSDSVVPHGYSSNWEKEPFLRVVTSEIVIKNIPSNAGFLNTESGSIGDDLNDSSSNEEYPIESDDFEENVDLYVIVSKYGLPSKTRCTCQSNASVPSSSSCTILKRSVSETFDISNSKSCFEFTKNSEDLDNICMKHVNNLRSQKHYKEASLIYEMFMKTSNLSDEFDDVEYSCQLQFPYLWAHLAEYFKVYPDPDWVSKENETMLKIIHSCKCMLKEEEIYRVSNIDLFKTKLDFSGKKKDLRDDFEIACDFLKEEYPFLFTVLTWKHKLSKFVIERLLLEKRRLKVIQMSKLPYDILLRHNETCRAQIESSEYAQFEDYEVDEDVD